MRLQRTAFAFALSAAALLSGCDGTPASSQAHAQPAMKVSTEQVKLSDQRPQKTLLAKAISPADIELKSKTTGLVEQIHQADGSYVKAGDLLFTVEGENLKLALDKAQAELQTQKASLVQLTREASRQANLLTNKAASQQDFDDAVSAKAVQQATVNAAIASVNLARKEYTDSLVKAPFSGLLGEASIAQGDYVSPGSSLNTLTSIDPVWVSVGIAQTDFDKLYSRGSTGADVEVILENGEVVQGGKIDYVAPTVDSAFGSLTVRATVPNPKGLIKPGQFVTARLMGAPLSGVAKVPQKAVQISETGPYVFVAKGGKAEIRQVDAQNWDGTYWTINKGLAEGDAVITDNLLNMHAGASVEPNAQKAAE